MRKLIAVFLLILGLVGLGVARMGETTWAPPTSRTASITIPDPGAAVVINPGVLYVGGTSGKVKISSKSGKITMITAANSDIDGWLGKERYVRVTGLKDWHTFTTKVINPEGGKELPSPKGSDLWRTENTADSPLNFTVEGFAADESGQMRREILLMGDGKSAAPESIQITWPHEASNPWVPWAYGAGAAAALIGAVMLLIGMQKNSHQEDAREEEASEHSEQAASAGAVAVAIAEDDAEADGAETGEIPALAESDITETDLNANENEEPRA
ncbi:hypothetical protein ACUH9Y_06100 [Dermabacteraceae bacterium P13115]|nr:hypothetical protein [Dermabacteraceae bacterium TAE3-ERU5]